jgi:hypothetical protein
LRQLRSRFVNIAFTLALRADTGKTTDLDPRLSLREISLFPLIRNPDTLYSMASNIKLAVIPGDGIGVEVVAEGLKVLSA